MPVFSNLLAAAIFAPFVVVLSTISLSTLQRGINYVNFVAMTPQKGYLRKLKPYFKHVNTFLERIMNGNEFQINAMNIFLMAIVVLLLCLLLEGSEKPKRVIVADKKKSD